MSAAINSFCMYFKRTTGWRLNQVEPTEEETNKLVDKGDVTNKSLQKYLVWRKTILSVSVLPILFSTIMGFIGIMGTIGRDTFNALGNFVRILPGVDGIVLFLGVVLSRWWWHLPRRSTRLLKILWAVSFVMPLVQGLFPIEMLVNSATREALYYDAESLAILLGIKVQLAISYAIQIVPIIVTFPSSFGRAGLRMRGLYPTSTSLPGWMLLICIPFYSLFVFMAIVVITQLVGSGVLLASTILLVSGPWIIVHQGDLYVNDVSTAEMDKRLNRTQAIVATVNGVGVVLFLIWALTAEAGGVSVTGSSIDETALLTYGDVVRLGFEMIGRLLVTTVVFGDLLIQMVAKNWAIEQDRRTKEDKSDSIDETYLTLFGLNGSERKTAKDAESSSPSYVTSKAQKKTALCEKTSGYDLEAPDVGGVYAIAYARAPEPHGEDEKIPCTANHIEEDVFESSMIAKLDDTKDSAGSKKATKQRTSKKKQKSRGIEEMVREADLQPVVLESIVQEYLYPDGSKKIIHTTAYEDGSREVKEMMEMHSESNDCNTFTMPSRPDFDDENGDEEDHGC